jgi:hypothetical protein
MVVMVLSFEWLIDDGWLLLLLMSEPSAVVVHRLLSAFTYRYVVALAVLLPSY